MRRALFLDRVTRRAEAAMYLTNALLLALASVGAFVVTSLWPWTTPWVAAWVLVLIVCIAANALGCKYAPIDPEDQPKGQPVMLRLSKYQPVIRTRTWRGQLARLLHDLARLVGGH